MATVLPSFAWETTPTVGVGPYALAGAVSPWLTFQAAGLADGQLTFYSAFDGQNFEQGRGTYSVLANELARTEIIFSTNSPSPGVFNPVSWGAGLRQIMLALPGSVIVGVLNWTNPAGAMLVPPQVVTSGASAQMLTDKPRCFVNKTVGSATEVLLPSSPADGQIAEVYDLKGDAATNNITVTGPMVGASSYVIDGDWGWLKLQYIAAAAAWVITG